MRAQDAMLLLAALMSMLWISVASDKPIVKIGVVSSPAQVHNLAAAVEAALISGNAKPVVSLKSVEPDEPLDMLTQVCEMAAEGVSAIVAYGEPEDVKLAAAVAARAAVPLLLVSPTPLTPSAEGLRHWETIHMFPQADIFIKACAALCKEKGWSSAVLLHEGAVGARLVQGADEAGIKIAILARRLPPAIDEEALRNLLLVLKKAEHTRFIVWCDEACIERVLGAAQRVGLLSERHSYILLALDLHTLDMEPFSHGGANITGLQLFDPKNETEILINWRETYLRRMRDDAFDTEEDSDFSMDDAQIQADGVVAAPLTALILTYDVVLTASDMLFRLPIIEGDSDETSCDPLHSYAHADTLINYLRSNDNEDWPGRAGQRRAGRLFVTELARGGNLTTVGTWFPRHGVDGVLWDRKPIEVPPLPPGVMTNQTFVVLIMLSEPYVMNKAASERLSGNDRYEGFCIELFEKLSGILNFNYTLLELPGDAYDMMLDRINKTKDAHFAITDLTITADRERKVDFTTPFMNLGISILYRKPSAPDPKLFAFMLPFSTGVWFCLGVAYVGTSLVLYVVGRLCPEEWQNPYPCIEEPEALENQFTLSNALWFTLGAILCQGSEIAPVAYGSRAVASAWWIFALVITSSYTANLATLLAKKSNNVDFTNVAELASNGLGIKYGAKVDGATYKFLKHSQEGLYKDMFEKMKEWDMPMNNKEGIDRVNQDPSYGRFAFLMESTSIEYQIERNCNLTQVGGLIDSKGYGIAMAKDSSYRQALNLALLNLQEAGELRVMKHRWWKEMNGGGGCDGEEQPENAKLTMKNFLGLFLVLGTGCVLGVFISLADLMVAAWRQPRDPTASYWRRLGDELRFVFHFQQSDKPVHGPLIPPPSPKSESITSEHLGEQEEERIDSRLRSASFQSSGLRSRRRSSMHNASVRLARHARQRDPSTPNRLRVNSIDQKPMEAII